MDINTAVGPYSKLVALLLLLIVVVVVVVVVVMLMLMLMGMRMRMMILLNWGCEVASVVVPPYCHVYCLPFLRTSQ